MSNKVIILGLICLIVAIAVYQYKKRDSQTLSVEEKTAIALRKVIGNRTSSYNKVAVGTNSNVDLIVSGVALLRKLDIKEQGIGKDCSDVSSLDVLEECFSYYMGKGAAAERSITTRELNSEIVAAALRLPDSQHFVGGNAALVGLKFTTLLPEGKVMLCGPVGPKLKTLLPEEMFIPKSCEMRGDENHLILEYKRNEKWGNIEAPVANRFIMSHDVANSALTTLENFIVSEHKKICIAGLNIRAGYATAFQEGYIRCLPEITDETIAFKPDLIVVSGFHLLDSQKEDFWQQRIADAAIAFSRLPHSVPVHLELASMSHCPVMVAIVKLLFPLVNSIGLNEQELAFISRCLSGIHADMDVVKKIDEIGFYSDITSWVLQEYGKNGRLSENSRLTRVHFHCLYVHILAVLPYHWRSNEASVSQGSWTAFSQACDTTVVNSNKAELRIPSKFNVSLLSPNTVDFDTDSPISVASHDNVNLYISPVLVCKRPLKTVGLGDAISASGLMYNVFIE